MELSSDSVVVSTSSQVGADLGEEVILLHLKNGQYYGLEKVGARIWKVLDKPIRVGEIERLLLNEYDIDPESCRREVRQLLSDLIDQGFVEVTED